MKLVVPRKLLVLVVFICFSFHCVFVDGRAHYYKKHPKHNVSESSVALSPSRSPANIQLPSDDISPAPVPPEVGIVNINTSSRNITVHTPAPEPINAVSNRNSTNSTNSLPPLLSPPLAAPSVLNSIPIFDIRTFGAKGDGQSDDTEAFKGAWDSACNNGGPGIVLVPQRYSFKIRSTIFAGPCMGALVLQVDGKIMPPDGPDEWPLNNSKRQWIVFYRANGLTLQGGGVIDGRGEKWWDLPCKPHKGINGTIISGTCDSPVALRFFMSSNLIVHGIRVKNSPQFHFRFDNCRNVSITSITINSPASSPNTDGIHVENSEMVGIYNSVISNGDDCVSIGAGSFNIDIRNVTCGPSHGISIGSLGKANTQACVSNVTVRDSVIRHSDNGVRIKTWQGGKGSVSSITFQNIVMDTVRNPIMIDQYYCLSKVCANQTSAVFVSHISYTNIKGTYDVRSPSIHLGCSDSVPCTNITFSNVELFPSDGYIFAEPFCWNVYGVSQTLTIPPVSCLLEGLPGMIMDDESSRCI